MKSKITYREKEIFEQYRKRPLHDNVIEDGVVDEQTYLAQKIKILFILKEVNNVTESGWSLTKFLSEGGRKATWDNISKWVYGIRNIEKEISWSELESFNDDVTFRQNQLKGIAAMNVKKLTGSHTADSKTIWNHLQSDLLLDQLKLYSPDITICCGSPTGDVVQSLLNFKAWDHTTRGIWYQQTHEAGLLIYYFHPEARVGENLLYYGLIDSIKEIIKKDPIKFQLYHNK